MSYTQSDILEAEAKKAPADVGAFLVPGENATKSFICNILQINHLD
jgi:hypothetical protein